ncbi:MAG: Maf family nucleotide pyrophosphatase [Gammaproteobacteria bacterium]|nr:Maf family nucleotide pyrophosphatase [Gammaproteobacteria bacterium]
MPNPALILASSSPFRRELLSRLQLSFESISPEVDESPRDGEDPVAYVQRLAGDKARSIALEHPQAVVIGSDQCSYLDGQILGKPGSHENALKQLQQARGREVIFYTGLSVQHQASGFHAVDYAEFHVGFRDLTDQQLEHYLQVEQPYDCAGSFKSENYGITLFSHMSGDDPTTLVGLPLIKLTQMLERAGVQVL